MRFNRQLFKEAYKAGYKKARLNEALDPVTGKPEFERGTTRGNNIGNPTMSNISITIKGVMIKSASELYSDMVVFYIYVKNGVPEEQIKAMCRVRLYDTRPGDIIHDEKYEDGHTTGVLRMLDLLTKESWSAHLIGVAWKMQKDKQEETEEHYQI